MTRGGDPPSLAQLLGHRLRLSVRGFRGAEGIRHRLSLALAALAASVLFWASWQIFAALRAEESAALAQMVLQIGLHSFFLFVLLRDAVAVPGHLFRAPDAALLWTAPIPAGRLLPYRLAEALLDSASAVLLFGAPFVLGFATAAPHPVAALVAAAGALFGLLLLSVLLFAVVSVLWPEALGRAGHRRRALFRVMGLVFLVGFFGLLTRPGSEMAGGSILGVATAAAAIEAFAPSGWAGRWVGAAAEGHVFAADALLSFALATIGLAFPLSRMTERWRDASRRAAEGSGGGSEARSARGFLRGGFPVRRPSVRLAAVLWRRDWLLLVREPGMLLDLATMAALLGFLPLLWRLNAAAAPSSTWSFVLAAVVGAELAYEIASRSLPLERQATRWVRTAPVSVTSECCARPLLGLAVGWLAAIGVLLLGAILLRLPVLSAVPILAIGLLVPPAAVLGWAASLYFCQPLWRHPRQMLRLPGRLLLLAVAAVAGIAAAAAVANGPTADSGGTPLSAAVLGAACVLASGAAFLWSRHARRSLE